MANANPSRVGQANLAGDAKALFLKVFAGEVLAAFEETNIFMQRTQVRSISSGKSASFPVVWKGSASYHTPGTELQGTTVAHNEVVISIDDLLVADRFLASIDEAMSHYDVRSIYSKDVGRALAQQLDKNLAQLGYNGANDAATVTGGNGGTSINDTDGRTNGSSLAASIFTGGQNLDEKDVPEDGRWCYVLPAQYSLLVQTDKLLNRDFGGNPGVYSDGTLLRVAGIGIIKSNNLPNTNNITTGPAAYQGDFSNSIALIMHTSGVGTVKLMDLAVESGYDIRRQGTLVVAKFALGSGVLRPDACIEVATA